MIWIDYLIEAVAIAGVILIPLAIVLEGNE